MTISKSNYKKEILTSNPKILHALEYAEQKHSSQIRKSGEPYITHCIEVYKTLLSWGVLQEDLLIAALLHDVVEDTNTTLLQIKKLFGDEVGFLVDNVTKLHLSTQKDKNFETLKKVLSGSIFEPKVAILKLSDRYHNLKTLEYLPKHKQIIKAKESLDVYAKLAEALGIWVVKTEIEDMSFKYLDPKNYLNVKKTIDQDLRLEPSEIIVMLSKITQLLNKNNILGTVKVKKSGYYQAFQKLKSYSVQGISTNGDYNKINDILSYRVIVKNIVDCYRMLCEIHLYFGSSVDYSRLDEYIGANKRVNGYESLQTTVDTPIGSIEIAIATEEMENFNNWGYLEYLKANVSTTKFNLTLIFNSNNELVFLPENSKVIDFAYAISKKLGDSALKAKVNGELRPLSYILQNTDVVEIVTGERSKKVDVELLDICLPKTKTCIDSKLLGYEKNVAINKGKKLLQKHLMSRGLLDLSDLGSVSQELAFLLRCENLGEVYYKLAQGYLDIIDISELLDDYNLTKQELGWTTVQINGIDKPGILKSITNILTGLGGNLIKIYFDKNDKKENFYMRLVVENLTTSKEIETKKLISKIKYISKVLVV